MSKRSSPGKSALQALVDSIELIDVRYTHLSATREDVDSPSHELDLKMSFHSETAEDGTYNVIFQAHTEANHPKGRVQVTAAAEYALPASKAAWLDDQDLMLSFGNEVALFTLVPYLRQAISDTSTRVLRSTVTIPLFKR